MKAKKQQHFSLARLIPLAILLLGLGIFFYFRLYEYINLQTLKTHRALILVLSQNDGRSDKIKADC